MLALLAAAAFTCTPAQVWDGDTFTCADGRKIRIAGIAAREVKWTGAAMIDAGCSEGHPCPGKSGVEAREHLARLFGGGRGTGPHGHILVNGPVLRCEPNGRTRSRLAAWCASPATGDVSCRMVRGGYAVRWEKFWKGRRC